MDKKNREMAKVNIHIYKVVCASVFGHPVELLMAFLGHALQPITRNFYAKDCF